MSGCQHISENYSTKHRKINNVNKTLASDTFMAYS